MPRKDPEQLRAYKRSYMKAWRAARRAVPVATPPPTATDPGAAIVAWARESLRIPPGHPRAGLPLVLPDYLAAFVVDIFRYHESLLCISRKNAKSTATAVVLLSMLAGPTRARGFRAGVVSTSHEKSRELQLLMSSIADASGLVGIQFLKSPRARAVSATGACDFLPATSSAGAAAGYDLAIVDEIGLLVERDRDLVNSMRSSVSARDGRFVSLSVRGTAPFIPEILARRGDPDLAVHLYESDPKAPLDDEVNWKKANPGLGSVKAVSYMRRESTRSTAHP